MAVSWTTVGNIREWVAKSWTDFLTLAARARVGDRCFLTTAEGECYLTRKVVVTTDGNKTRWVPDDTARWGKNNLCTTDVFAGSVSDEGIWTITNVSYTLVDADLDRSYECLAIVFD